MSAATDDESETESSRVSGVRVVLRALDNRARLAVLEFQEARTRAVGLTAAALGVVLLLQLVLVAGLVVLVAATWHTSWRVGAPALAGLVFGGGGVVLACWLRARMREWRPFLETLGQLSRDVRSLEQLVRPPSRED